MFWLIISLLYSLCLAQDCPSGAWTQCTEKGNYMNLCNIPSEITSGFMSIAVESPHEYYKLIPFRSTNISEITMLDCRDATHPYYGGYASCCYIEMENDFTDDYWGYVPYTAQDVNYFDFGPYDYPIGYRLHFNSNTTGRTITNSTYVYRVAQGARAYCSRTAFRQYPLGIYDYFNASCNYGLSDSTATRTPTSLLNSTFHVCANQGKDCEGLEFLPYWIRMGTGNKFYYQLIIPANGAFRCEEKTFDAEGAISSIQPQFCYVSEPITYFADKVGDWYLVNECYGCPRHTITETIGISRNKETGSVMTDYWRQKLRASLSVGIKYGPFGASASTKLTQEQSSTITQSMSESINSFEMIEKTQICDKNQLWQWQATAMDNNMMDYGKQIVIKASNFFCGNQKPRCPATYCDVKDPTCQTCSYDFGTEQQLVPVVINAQDFPQDLPQDVIQAVNESAVCHIYGDILDCH